MKTYPHREFHSDHQDCLKNDKGVCVKEVPNDPFEANLDFWDVWRSGHSYHLRFAVVSKSSPLYGCVVNMASSVVQGCFAADPIRVNIGYTFLDREFKPPYSLCWDAIKSGSLRLHGWWRLKKIGSKWTIYPVQRP